MSFSSKKINVITLGCSKNVVDSEKLMAQLQHGGYTLLHDSDDSSARTIIINTCGFIGDAKEESINTILDFAEAKKRGEIDKLFVFGCLSERYKSELQAELGSEVDEFFGVNNIEDILRTLGVQHKNKLIGERLLSTPPHYAYLKVSEGCNWGCSYCAIPLIRGKHVSTPIEDLVAEAQLLAAKGVKEIMLIAQDLTYYGLDIYGKRRLADLLTELCKIDGIAWLRLHYAYPTQFPLDVLEVMRRNPKICKYLDIPFQHVNDNVLQQMRRGNTRQQSYELMRAIRTQIPDVALRTTLIVGHPGEDEAAFAELLDFVREVRFERLGVFTYSEEEGTYGAKHLKDEIPQEEKQRRADILMKLQAGISASLNQEKVGKTFRTIIDRKEGEYHIGRTEHDSPEVDGEVLIKSETPLTLGEFYSVKITSADEFDLYGEV
ncbi:MAG: 30S ribosomal protein S12 methylthiotransferase RimO [Prevotellaceae bacterium]|jgi:ribosomal protein S12 methylthiotransferase|nr:30S ribosomal protein S12 methylthiotransferase RimO [Prevotellaceae bacterium]